MKSQTRPIGVDLFAGAGGMTLGFEQAGFDVLASVEIDPVHCATHEYNFPFWTVLCRSVVNTTGEEIRKLSAIGDRDIDVVFGGPPCQGFSLIGKRSLEDPRNELVFHFLRLVIELQPKFFVMENVPGLTIGKHKKFLLEIIDEFKAKGYQVAEKYQVLNAANYGVPQNRSRLFLLGCRQGLTLPAYPQPIANINSRRHCTNVPSGIPTVWDAIGDLPPVELYDRLYERDWAIAEYGQPSNYARQLRNPNDNPGDFSSARKYDPRLITSSLLSKHSLETQTRFAITKPGHTEKISRFYKLHPQGISNTLRAGTASNRGAFTSPRPIHPYTPRCITVREAARLHSYPDWFRFHVTKWHGFRQVGNSVPPLLAKAVATEIMRVLGISIAKPRQIQLLGDAELIQLNMSRSARKYGVNPHAIEPRNRRHQKAQNISEALENLKT